MIFLLCCIIIGACNSGTLHDENIKIKDQPPSRYFDSTWTYSPSGLADFSFQLKIKGDSLKGYYCYTSLHKIDCGTENNETDSICMIRGTANGNIAMIVFTSNWTEPKFKDTAKLVIDEKNETLTWIRKSHHIHAYVPDSTVIKLRGN